MSSCRRSSGARAGTSPSSTAAAVRSVKSTTRQRRRASRRTCPTMAPASASTNCGSRTDIASDSDARVALSSRARGTASAASRSIRSPARNATAARSSAASRAASSRGASPTRAALVRPVSSTTMSRRSRSGRYWRTCSELPAPMPLVLLGFVAPRRAEARQSIVLTSSPRTYSRRLSNSVPRPGPRVATRPSMTRSRESFSGSSFREGKAGCTRIRPGTETLRWRAPRWRGP